MWSLPNMIAPPWWSAPLASGSSYRTSSLPALVSDWLTVNRDSRS